MNVTVKKTGNSKVELVINTGKDAVKEKYDDVYAHISKEAKVPGFRPGKVPVDIIKKRFSDSAKAQVIQELTEDLYTQAIKNENIFVISHPQISDVNLSDSGFSFKAAVEVKPEVNIKKYKGIKIKRESVEITDAKVKEALEKIKKDKNAETIDDGFAKSLGYPTLANLEEVIKNQLFVASSENSRHKYETQVADYLLEHCELELPPSIIERELKERLDMLDYQLARQGIAKDKVQEKKNELGKTLKDAVVRDLKVYFIMDKIAALENIALDEKHSTEKVMEFLLKEAEWAE